MLWRNLLTGECMDFQLTEEQKMLKDMTRKISLNEFAHRAAEIDEKEAFPWENKKILEENDGD